MKIHSGGVTVAGPGSGLASLRTIAQPSLTQLVLRFGLAVPVWQSGVSKWDVFLQLNDVATLLFSSEFQLHLPGGPYPFPAPAIMAFVAGSAEILANSPCSRSGDTLSRVWTSGGLLAMTLVVQLTVLDGWPSRPICFTSPFAQKKYGTERSDSGTIPGQIVPMRSFFAILFPV